MLWNICSMEICKIFISVTMGQGQFRYPLLCCPRTYKGTSPWTPGIPPIAKSLANPKMVPLMKISSSLLLYPPFLHLNTPTLPSSPQSFPSPFSLTFSLSLYLIPIPMLPTFALQSCLLPISRRIYICFSLGSPCYLAFLGLSTIGLMSFVYD